MTRQLIFGEINDREMLQVFLSIPGVMSILWKTSQKRNILLQDYTAQIGFTTALEELTTDDFISKFPSVFDGQVQVMTGETLHIYLKDIAKPFARAHHV